MRDKPKLSWKPEKDKRVCTECHFKMRADELVKHYYKPGDEWWIVCPNCHAPEHIRVACYYPDCWEEAPCGSVAEPEYVFTCGKHAP